MLLFFELFIYNTIRHERFLPCLLSFCVFDYELVDAIGVPALRYEFVAIFKQALDDEVLFG